MLEEDTKGNRTQDTVTVGPILYQYFDFLLLGVFVARGKEDILLTKNLVPGKSVYGEKKIELKV